MTTDLHGLRDTALDAWAAGLQVLPPKQDGSKRPDTVEWKSLQTRRMTLAETLALFTDARTGIGALTGRISTGIVLFEFDDGATYERFKASAASLGWGNLVARIEQGYCEDTPGGGVHWLVRVPEIGGNTKLATRPKRPEEMADPHDKVKTLIETREDGGYVVLAPSHGTVHETGRPYVLRSGSFETIETLNEDEQERLWSLARTFDEMPFETVVADTASSVSDRAEDGPGVIQDFNARTTWRELLDAEGWTFLRSVGEVGYWKRPGKTDRGGSATTNYGGADRLCVFSSSTDLRVTDPRGGSRAAYDRFGFYAETHHGGDQKAAARELFARGYGSRERMNGHAQPPLVVGGKRPVLPEIYADEQDLRIVTGLAWAALVAANTPEPMLFRHGGQLVRVEAGEHGRPIFRELAISVARHEMARAAVWWGMRGPQREKVRKIVVPPEVVCQDVLATPNPPLPEVVRIVECPAFGPDWSLRSSSGYHAAAQTYCAIPEDVAIPTVLLTPGEEEMARALALVLDDLMGDFPFESPADRANALALFLLPYVRDTIRGPTPLHVVESPTVGTGKGLLVDALLRPSCGRSVAIMAQCRDGDEWRKRITATLRGGHPAVQIDNVTHALDSGELAMAITVPYWTDRILGSTQTVAYPVRCVWALTANNPTLSTEMARRSIRIRLDSKADRPWEREDFRHKELLGWVDDHRGDLIWAGLTLVQSWLAANRPAFSGKALGSFEPWSRVLGGILEHIGVRGFLGNLAEFYDNADTEGTVWRAFVEAWWEKYGGEKVGASDLFALASEVEGMDIGQGNERSQKITFGKALAKQRDRVIGTYVVKHAGTAHRLAAWRLQPTEQMI